MDLRHWVAEDDLVRLLIHAVERLPLSAFTVNSKGCGDEQYPPHMTLALPIYGYPNGILSSRCIDQATYRDIAVRYLSGNIHRDQYTASARQRKSAESSAPSARRLTVAATASLWRLSTCHRESAEGTKMSCVPSTALGGFRLSRSGRRAIR